MVFHWSCMNSLGDTKEQVSNVLDSLRNININWDLVEEDLIEVLPYLLPSLAAVVILFILIFGVWLFVKKKPLPFPFLLFFFLWDGAMMGYISLLCREPGSRDSVDLTFFAFLERGQWAIAFALENILFFIPFGILTTWMLKKSSRRFCFLKSTISGFAVSVLIETTQMVTKRGFVQAEDVMLNTAGTMIGSLMIILIYAVLHMINIFLGFLRQKKLLCQKKW